MTEFIIRRAFGENVEVGIAVPGFNAERWATSDKYWFTIPRSQASKLGTSLLALCEGTDIGEVTVEEES